MESNFRNWARSGVSIPHSIILLSILIVNLAPDRVSHYGWSLLTVAVAFQYLATKNVGPAVAGINKFLRLGLISLWLAGFILNLSIVK